MELGLSNAKNDLFIEKMKVKKSVLLVHDEASQPIGADFLTRRPWKHRTCKYDNHAAWHKFAVWCGIRKRL